MRPSTSAVVLALCLTVHGATGCTSWRVQSVDPRVYLVREHPSAIRVTDTAKARFVIRSPVVEGDSVRAFTGGVERRIPMAAVDRVTVRRLNPLKTAWWFVLAPIGALAAVVGVGCAFDPCTFSMSY